MSKRRRAHVESEVNRDRNREKVEEINAIADLQWVMSDVHGRRFVSRLLQTAAVEPGIRLDSNGRGDPMMLAQLEGMRVIGEDLDATLQTYCPDEYIMMTVERLKEDAKEERVNG